MSAYQVNEKCLYEVMSLINKVYGSGEHYEENQKIKDTCRNKPEVFFNWLSKLNNWSLVQRYPDLKDNHINKIKKTIKLWYKKNVK